MALSIQHRTACTEVKANGALARLAQALVSSSLLLKVSKKATLLLVAENGER